MTDAFERAVDRERAQRQAHRDELARTGFKWHATVYVAVNVLLVVVWAAVRSQVETMHPWFLYPIFGWGIGLVFHYVAVRPAYRARAARVSESEPAS